MKNERNDSAAGESFICTHEYEILDEIRESSIGDDEEPGDWAGYGLLRLVRFSVLGTARGAQLIASASGHQLKRLQKRPSALVGEQAEGGPAVRNFRVPGWTPGPRRR